MSAQAREQALEHIDLARNQIGAIDKALRNADPNHKPRTGNKAESAQTREVKR